MGEPLVSPRLLLVEGDDESHAFEAIMDAVGIIGIEIRSFGGIQNLRAYLKALRLVSGFDDLVSLGIVRDAESNANDALRSVRDSLQAAGFPVPATSLTPAEGRPRTMILINPHGRLAGSLDAVCLQAVGEDPAMTCVDEYFQCLDRQGIVLGANVSKARAHAFIASRQRPDVSLGVAVKRGYFPLGHAAFDPLRQLLGLLSA